MRLRAVLHRVIDGIARRIAGGFTRLLGRAPASEGVPARAADRTARRLSALRPGPLSPARLAADDVADARDARNDHVLFGAPDPAPLPFGDFADRDEAERFAVLPPIGAGAGAEVDWDALARALTGDR